MCRPTRTRIGPDVRAVVNAAAAATAPGAVGKTKKNASPCVSTSTPPSASARVANHSSVLGERLRVVVRAELVQEPGRALDVGEEEGDRARGKVGPHGGASCAGTLQLQRRGPNVRQSRARCRAEPRAASSGACARLPEVADEDDADEDQPDDEHREHDVACPPRRPSSRLAARRWTNAASIAATLPDEPGVRCEGGSRRNRRPPRGGRPRRARSNRRACAARRARRRGRPVRATTRSPPRRRRRRSLPAARACAHRRDQLREVGDRRDVTRLGDVHEPVCIEVVAEQERRVPVGGANSRERP